MRFTPAHETEANIQAEFYHACKVAGIGCSLDYRSLWSGPAPNDAWFDAVIHDGQVVRAIVEFKRTRKDARRRQQWADTRQCRKYKAYDLPIYLVTCREEIGPVVAKLAQEAGTDGA